MKNFVDKLKRIEGQLAQEHGPFTLFALFLREDAPGKWDLVIAAPWIEKNKQSALKTVAQTLQKSLKQYELLNLSRIVIIDQSNPALDALHRAIHVEHGDTEIKDSTFFGLQIKHAYLITSRRANSPPAPNEPASVPTG